MTSVLTVDDSASIRMAIRMALSGEGHGVTEAADGKEGLAAASASKFDMIITDLCVLTMNHERGLFELTELAPGVSVQEVVDKTEAELIVSDEPAVVAV